LLCRLCTKTWVVSWCTKIYASCNFRWEQYCFGDYWLVVYKTVYLCYVLQLQKSPLQKIILGWFSWNTGSASQVAKPLYCPSMVLYVLSWLWREYQQAFVQKRQLLRAVLIEGFFGQCMCIYAFLEMVGKAFLQFWLGLAFCVLQSQALHHRVWLFNWHSTYK
jgi:hypothetical protein